MEAIILAKFKFGDFAYSPNLVLRYLLSYGIHVEFRVIYFIGAYRQFIAMLRFRDKCFYSLLCLKEHAFISKREVKSQPNHPSCKKVVAKA